MARLRIWRLFKRGLMRLSLGPSSESGLPGDRAAALADQDPAGSKSVCANLAEGFARQGFAPADFRGYLIMALGSADEMRLWVPCVSISAILMKRPGRSGVWCASTPIAKMLQGLRKCGSERDALTSGLSSVICHLAR